MHKIIKNVFSKKEIEYLKNVIQEKESLNLYTLKPDTGRIFIKLDILNQTITNKVEKIIKNYYNKNYKITKIAFHRYKLEYGTPNLKPHIDTLGLQIVFNYQIESNKNWDIIINGEVIKLKDNDAVIFEGEKDLHARKLINFDSNDYVSMLAFICVTNDHWSNFTDIDPMRPEQRKKLEKYMLKKWEKEYSEAIQTVN